MEEQISNKASEYYSKTKETTIKTTEAYRVGMAALLTNPKYFALACLIEMIILWLIFTNGVHLTLVLIIQALLL